MATPAITRQIRYGLGASYLRYVKFLAPALWYRLNELSGSVAVNAGTLGTAYNGAYTACTLAQAGKMSASGAVLFDGATSLITVPANPFGNYSTFTVAALTNPSSAGESNTGEWFEVSTGGVFHLRFNGSMNGINAIRNAATPAVSTSASGLSTGWQWLFETFDNGGNKKIHLHKGVSGAVSEYTYPTQQAAVGALNNYSATVLTIGNRPNAALTFAGLYDEFLVFPSVLTPAQMAQIVRLTGV